MEKKKNESEACTKQEVEKNLGGQEVHIGAPSGEEILYV